LDTSVCMRVERTRIFCDCPRNAEFVSYRLENGYYIECNCRCSETVVYGVLKCDNALGREQEESVL
jgi:hypothetical protein